VNVLAVELGEMEQVAALIEGFLSASSGPDGVVEVGSEDGKVWRCASSGGCFREENGSVSHEEVLALAGVAAGGGLSRAVERVDIADGGMGVCVLADGMAAEVEAVMHEVAGDARVRCGREVCGPLWLIGLSLRLCLGEKVVFARPGELWRPVVEMLSRRDVQAFVVGPAREARALGFCVLE
jgi:hypothetical protein